MDEQGSGIQLPENYQMILGRLDASVRLMERVVAAFLGGSFAREAGDAYSDLDLNVITADAAYDDFFAGRAAFIRQLGSAGLSRRCGDWRRRFCLLHLRRWDRMRTRPWPREPLPAYARRSLPGSALTHRGFWPKSSSRGPALPLTSIEDAPPPARLVLARSVPSLHRPASARRSLVRLRWARGSAPRLCQSRPTRRAVFRRSRGL